MKLIRDLYGDLGPWGKVWLYLGLGSLFAAAAMSMDFGWSVSIKHAIFLGILSLVAAFAPAAAYDMFVEGKKTLATVIAVICVPLLGIEFYSHAGYTAGLRGHNLSEARVQNIKYDGAQERVTDHKANLAMWREQLAKLNVENAWAAATKADGLRAQLDSAQKAIDLEAAAGGCKSKCLARMKEKATLEERIATVEKATDLTTRIEATQRLVDKSREVAAVTEHKSSAVDHQNKFLSNAVALFKDGSLKPTAIMDETAQQSVNLAMAIAGTGLPAFALFMAGLYRTGRPEPTAPHVEAASVPNVQSIPPVEQRYGPPPAQPRRFGIQTMTVHDLIGKAV